MTDPTPPNDDACRERTRSAVLNVLIVAGVGIAVSGVLLRWRDGAALSRAPEGLGRGLMTALAAVAVASYLARRAVGEESARFHRAHVTSASLGALAVPLGLAYGWLVRPRLDAVAPFWVAALALGFLALPRASRIGEMHP